MLDKRQGMMAHRIGLRNNASKSQENSNQAAVAEGLSTVYPAACHNEACLGMSDHGTANWAGFVDD